MAKRVISEIRLINGSDGDPTLYVDYPGRDDALLFDAGDNGALPLRKLADLEALFITHHHIDHFIGFDRVLRANMGTDKTVAIFGPEGTIARILGRVRSYEFQFFPFQKVVFDIREVLADRIRRGRLECRKRFAEPEIEETDWTPPVVYETGELAIEAVHVDHTVPCLAYAVVEKSGMHPDPDKLESGLLRPGPWIGEATTLIRSGADPETILQIQGGEFRLGELSRQYFKRSTGSRVAFITDTRWNDELMPSLERLAFRAQRLYCDGYYLSGQAKQAVKYGHLTAAQAGQLARAAEVEQLILMHFAPRYRGQYHKLLAEAQAEFPGATVETAGE